MLDPKHKHIGWIWGNDILIPKFTPKASIRRSIPPEIRKIINLFAIKNTAIIIRMHVKMKKWFVLHNVIVI